MTTYSIKNYQPNPHGYPQQPDDRLPARGKRDGELQELINEHGEATRYRWSKRDKRWVDLGLAKPRTGDDIGEIGDIPDEIRLDWGETITVEAQNPFDSNDTLEIGEARTIEEYEQLMHKKYHWEMSRIREED